MKKDDWNMDDILGGSRDPEGEASESERIRDHDVLSWPSESKSADQAFKLKGSAESLPPKPLAVQPRQRAPIRAVVTRPRARRWRAVVHLVVVAGLIGAGVCWYLYHHQSDVQLINGLDIPVEVTMGDTAVALDPLDHETRRFQPGTYPVTVRNQAGEMIEEQEVEVPAGVDLVAYNVLGAAAVYAEGITYREISIPAISPENPYQLYCGQTFIVRDDVDYLWDEPPTQIQIRSSNSQETRWFFGFLDNGRFTMAIDALLFENRKDDALQLAQRVLRVDPANPSASYYTTLLDIESDSGRHPLLGPVEMYDMGTTSPGQVQSPTPSATPPDRPLAEPPQSGTIGAPSAIDPSSIGTPSDQPGTSAVEDKP